MLTIQEVAEKLNLHYNTVYSYIRKGELKAVQFDRVYRVKEKDLQEFLKKRKVVVK